MPEKQEESSERSGLRCDTSKGFGNVCQDNPKTQTTTKICTEQQEPDGVRLYYDDTSNLFLSGWL